MADENVNAQQGSKGWTAQELAQLEADSMDDDVFAERVLEQVRAAGPLLEKQQMYTIEKNIQADRMRRVALATATQSSSDLIQKIEVDREFAVLCGGIFDGMGELIERYKQLIDLFETVQARLAVALATREDMVGVIEEGKAAFYEH